MASHNAKSSLWVPGLPGHLPIHTEGLLGVQEGAIVSNKVTVRLPLPLPLPLFLPLLLPLSFPGRGHQKQNVSGMALRDLRLQLFLAGSLPTMYTSKQQCWNGRTSTQLHFPNIKNIYNCFWTKKWYGLTPMAVPTVTVSTPLLVPYPGGCAPPPPSPRSPPSPPPVLARHFTLATCLSIIFIVVYYAI